MLHRRHLVSRLSRTESAWAARCTREGCWRWATVAREKLRAPPMLAWLTVARDAREHGFATALLGLITTALRARGAGKRRSRLG
jgi:hypothetical protein